MQASLGYSVFLAAPILLAAVLLWRFPRYQRVRYRVVVLYLLLLGGILWGALEFVAYVASAKVRITEVLVVLWFAAAWRLAWTIWAQTVGRWGQRYVRWGRWRSRKGMPVPLPVRLIPAARIATTALVFAPAFLTCVFTHRCKVIDGQDPQSIFGMDFESLRIPTSDGLTLDAWFVPQQGAQRTIVICHGAGANKGNFIWYLGPLSRRGYNVAFFDFRAHGSSDGRLATYGIRERLT